MVVRIAAHGSRCRNIYVYVCVRPYVYVAMDTMSSPISPQLPSTAFLRSSSDFYIAEIRLVFKRRLSPARELQGSRRVAVSSEPNAGDKRRRAVQVGRCSWQNVRQEKEAKRQCLESRIDLIEDSLGILLQASLSAAQDRRTCPDCGP